MRHVDAETLRLLKQWEGFVPYAYDDADNSWTKHHVMPGDPVAGTLTIGYGHTGDVQPGQEVTEAQAEAMLRADLATAERSVERAIRVPLTDGQFGALVAFSFNVGDIATEAPTLVKLLNNSQYDAVPGQLQRFVNRREAGRWIRDPGLVNRRAAECGLWARGSTVAGNMVEASPRASFGGRHILAAASAGVGSTPIIASVLDAVSGSSYTIGQAQSWLEQHTALGYVVGSLLLVGVAWLAYTAYRQARG